MGRCAPCAPTKACGRNHEPRHLLSGSAARRLAPAEGLAHSSPPRMLTDTRPLRVGGRGSEARLLRAFRNPGGPMPGRGAQSLPQAARDRAGKRRGPVDSGLPVLFF